MQGHKIQFCPSWSKIHCTLVGIMNMPVAIAMIKIFSRKIMRCSVNAQSLYSRAGEKSRFSFKSQRCRYILIPDCKNEKNLTSIHIWFTDGAMISFYSFSKYGFQCQSWLRIQGFLRRYAITWQLLRFSSDVVLFDIFPSTTKIDLDNFAIRLNFYIVFEAYPP